MLNFKTDGRERRLFAQKGEAMPATGVHANLPADGRWSAGVGARGGKGNSEGASGLTGLIHRRGPVKPTSIPVGGPASFSQPSTFEERFSGSEPTVEPAENKALERSSAWPSSAYAPSTSPKEERKAKPAPRKRYQFTVRLEEDLVKRFVALSIRSGKTYQSILAESVKAYLDEHAYGNQRSGSSRPTGRPFMGGSYFTS